MKLAIVHDFLLSYGGAERVLEHVHELYPKAPVFTLRYNPSRMHHRMAGWDVRTSFVEHIPLLKNRGHTLAMSLYPLAIESFDLSEYDVVLSLSSAFAHGVLTPPETAHICYYHTPTRFLWDYHYQYLKEKGWDRGLKGAAAQRFLHRLRQWDFLAAKRPDVILANSKTVASRIEKFYRRDVDHVIYPGVDDTHLLSGLSHSDDYYVTISRLTPPKRVELAVEACTKLSRPLHVIGTGEDLDRLQKIAGPTIQFKGFLDDTALIPEIASSKALLWPGIDDFGLVPVEAMSLGKPVIAYNKGGATETVVDGKTGVLFDHQSTSGLMKAIAQFESLQSRFDAETIRSHAKPFSKIEFQKQLKQVIENAVNLKSQIRNPKQN